jgi:hypothetical protein
LPVGRWNATIQYALSAKLFHLASALRTANVLSKIAGCNALDARYAMLDMRKLWADARGPTLMTVILGC